MASSNAKTASGCLPSVAHIEALLLRLGRDVLGQEQGQVLRLVVAALLGGGHVLLEDVPGVGKTTLARSLAAACSASFSRIQMTADMLPADIIGVEVFDQRDASFVFRPGPIFTQVLLADELNRAPPRTQSSLLEAMGEGQVTVSGVERRLPQPFFVIATQNPVEHRGTYPLPESQLDRFAVSQSLGYPDAAAEELLAMAATGSARLGDGPALGAPESPPHEAGLTVAELLAAQSAVQQVKLNGAVAGYIVAIARASRAHEEVLLGASTRAVRSIASLARAWAFMDNRAFVNPDDVRAVTAAALGHRLVCADGTRQTAVAVVDELLASVELPR